MLTAASEEDAVMEAVAAGATGYLQKYSGKDRLLNTVRDVAQGEYRLPADVIRRVFAGIRGTAQSNADTGVRRLTAREREILTLFAQGLSYAKIAQTRGNQPVTIRNAIYGIQNKLGIETKQGLVVWAVRKRPLGRLPDREMKFTVLHSIPDCAEGGQLAKSRERDGGRVEPCRCSRPARDAAPTIAPTIFCSDRLAADAGPGRRSHRRGPRCAGHGRRAHRLPQIRPDALDAPDFVGIGAKPARQDGQRGRRNGGGSPWVPCQLARPRPM